MIRYALFFAAILSAPLQALTLDLPGQPKEKDKQITAVDTILIPGTPWNGEAVLGTAITGQVTTRIFQADIVDPPSALLTNLQKQLTDAGYIIQLACTDRACGGFDFRFALPIENPPHMFVDLGNYAFVSALKDSSSGIMVMASQSPNKAHVQITEVSPPGNKSTKVTAATTQATTRITGDLAETLEANGFFILSDLVFQVGSSNLDGEEFKSLSELADYLSANPHRTIALVGHTDATGSLDGNIALSKKRAGAVRTLLVGRYGVDGKRVAAEGMGYLSPVGPNTTDAGREQNRRVEVIITSSE